MFLTFTALSIVALIILLVVLVPRYGSKNVIIYVLICSILGAYTVMSCKGLSIGFKEIFTGVANAATYVLTTFFVLFLILLIVIQVNYLNKALDIFNTAIVTTVYYVLFTTLVLVASAILFKEFSAIAVLDIIGLLCGFATIVCALFLINFIKTSSNLELSLTDSLSVKNEANSNEKNEYIVGFNATRLSDTESVISVSIVAESEAAKPKEEV